LTLWRHTHDHLDRDPRRRRPPAPHTGVPRLVRPWPGVRLPPGQDLRRRTGRRSPRPPEPQPPGRRNARRRQDRVRSTGRRPGARPDEAGVGRGPGDRVDRRRARGEEALMTRQFEAVRDAAPELEGEVVSSGVGPVWPWWSRVRVGGALAGVWSVLSHPR